MVSAIVCLLVLLFVGYRVTTPEDRERLFHLSLEHLRRLKAEADKRRAEPDPFGDALRARTPLVLATPALMILNVALFVLMAFAPGPIRLPETLVSWGANVGPHTANGEWWRLLTALFIHANLLQLVVILCVLATMGRLLERYIGSFAFVGVYLSAGILSGVASVSSRPLDVIVGANGAILGLYGLLAAPLFWARVHRSQLTVPWTTLKSLAPGSALFLVYTLATGAVAGAGWLVSFSTGLIAGLALTRQLSEGKPSARQTAIAVVATTAVAVLLAVPLRGLTDIHPEIERVVSLEDETWATYQGEVARFHKNQVAADALIGLIDDTIVPGLREAHERLLQFDKVPTDDQPLVTSADEYFRLREKSWQLRVEGLRETDMRKLGEADRAQQTALAALQRLRPTAPD